ncbi:hypothetical protein MKK75_31885 [Methylobacterium sp. J-030]|uniref:hypothetical protein n=1 Tax=Methylobacterium sp. J-030 TaxID=2836627 RepID=UPI001FBBB5ED|nr:hypothetical protein [Methylobacterium sp. J-030]MCJ2073335.1 hypothetical protein [Methylobacterium sp. J-030]
MAAPIRVGTGRYRAGVVADPPEPARAVLKTVAGSCAGLTRMRDAPPVHEAYGGGVLRDEITFSPPGPAAAGFLSGGMPVFDLDMGEHRHIRKWDRGSVRLYLGSARI